MKNTLAQARDSFPFIDIFIYSRDICDQSLKLSENARMSILVRSKWANTTSW